MEPTIKICAKCGARNFADFNACFNCKSTSFVEDTGSQQGYKQMVDSISNKMDVALFSSPQSAASQGSEIRGFSVKIGEEKSDEVGAERNISPQTSADTSFSRTNIPTSASAVFQTMTQEPKAQPKILDRLNTEEENPSCINNKAQEEMVSRRRAEREMSGDMFTKITDTLSGFGADIKSETDRIRSTVSADITNLDRRFETLKNDNMHLFDTLVTTQKEQIEKRESELREIKLRIEQMSEERGRDKEKLAIAEDEKMHLEVELARERENCDRLIVDSNRFKELAPLEIDVPNDYIIYSGDYDNTDYREYAKKQFVKIYPKIVKQLDESEDVIYYIPGEYKNPPVLILNPKLSLENKRNLNLNLCEFARGAQVHIEESAKNLGDGKGEKCREEGISGDSFADHSVGMSEEQSEISAAKSISDSGSKAQENEKSLQRHSLGGESASRVIDSSTIMQPGIPDAACMVNQDRGIRAAKRIKAVSVLLGILLIASLATMFFAYAGEMKGWFVYASTYGSIFSRSANEFNVAIEIAAMGGVGIVYFAKYINFLLLGGGILTLLSAVAFIAGSGKKGGVTIAKFVLAVLALIADVLFVAALFVFFPQDKSMAPGLGIWIKVAIDFITIVLGIAFMRMDSEKQELNIKPMTVKV